MRYTDIVKARALRRAGRACEMCGTRLNFDSAQFVGAHPIFGILFDQDDCCVLCAACLGELDSETRAAAEEGPRSSSVAYETCEDPPEAVQIAPEAAADGAEDSRDGVAREQRDPPAPTAFARGPRGAGPRGGRLPTRDPDGGMCA